MINRRRFLQGVAGGVVLTSLAGLSNTFLLPKTVPLRSSHIPGWAPVYGKTRERGILSLKDFFETNYLGEDNPFTYKVATIHQDLYQPPLVHNELTEELALCIISAELKNLYDVERVGLFDNLIQSAYSSFGCFTLPFGIDGIPNALGNKRFTQQLNKLSCSIVLIDAQAIERTVPKLPMITANNNRVRILQTAISGMLAPLLLRSPLAIDSADLNTVLNNYRLIGMGVGYMSELDDLDRAADKAVNTICNQIVPGMDLSSKFNPCWVDISGNSKVLTMSIIEAVSNRIQNDLHEDASIVIGLTVDEGLDEDIMITCFAGLIENPDNPVLSFEEKDETPTFLRQRFEEKDEIPTFLRRRV